MGISDLIASFIREALEDADGVLELQRGDLAERFHCVPSQINYVISTRFSPERGYVVESRRGGGGYIRISRVRHSPRALLMHTVNAIGDRLDRDSAAAFVSNILETGMIDRQTARILLAAVGDNALRPLAAGDRDTLRASILKYMLVTLLTE